MRRWQQASRKAQRSAACAPQSKLTASSAGAQACGTGTRRTGTTRLSISATEAAWMLAAAACNAASCAAAAAGGAAAAEGAAPALPAGPGELPPTKVPARPPAASSSESPELEDEAQPRRPPLNRTVRPLRLPVGGAARCASCCCRTASIRPCPCRGATSRGWQRVAVRASPLHNKYSTQHVRRAPTERCERAAVARTQSSPALASAGQPWLTSSTRFRHISICTSLH